MGQEIRTKLKDLFIDVVGDIDFDKISSVMKFLDWRWANADQTFSVPNSRRIYKKYRQLFYEALDSYDHGEWVDTQECSSGGCVVRIGVKPELYVELSFDLMHGINYE